MLPQGFTAHENLPPALGYSVRNWLLWVARIPARQPQLNVLQATIRYTNRQPLPRPTGRPRATLTRGIGVDSMLETARSTPPFRQLFPALLAESCSGGKPSPDFR